MIKSPSGQLPNASKFEFGWPEFPNNYYLTRAVRPDSLQLHSRFVCQRPVQPWNRDVVQRQVNAQVGTEMNSVIQYEAAQHGNAWHREHCRAAAQKKVLNVS